MAEQVNQRMENMINELEQMKRTGLYDDYDLNDISKHRSKHEYQIQRHEKKQDDFVSYITYELALLENVVERRKEAKVTEKKKDIEYAIAARVNRIFKQFIHRFQNDVKVYFEYFKFCKSVGFNAAASGMISEMLQLHGDKPSMWQFASKWEIEEADNMEAAREFLLKGIQRHPEAEILYLELFKTELLQLTFKAEEEEEKQKLLKRADVVWRNGAKNVENVGFLFECLDLILKYEVPGDMKNSIMAELWAKKDQKEVLPFIAEKELEGCHWTEIEEFAETEFTNCIKYCIAAFEEVLTKFPEDKICVKYIHTLLGMDENICDEMDKIAAVKHAWWTGYKSDLLTDEMFEFGFNILKLEGETSNEDLWKILNEATETLSKLRSLWAEKLLLSKSDDSKMIALVQDAVKVLKTEDSIYLYNLMIDNIQLNETLKNLLQKLQSCENNIIMAVKPKLLEKMYSKNGLKAARDLYNDLIKSPPMQIEVHRMMINIETKQKKPNAKEIRRYFECAIVSHGTEDVDLWDEYVEFEIVTGEAVKAPSIYRRAMATLKPELVDKFVIKQCHQRAF